MPTRSVSLPPEQWAFLDEEGVAAFTSASAIIRQAVALLMESRISPPRPPKPTVSERDIERIPPRRMR